VKYKFRPEFFSDLEKYDIAKDLRHFSKPLVIIHSYADADSDFTNAEILYANANEPKKLVLLDNIDHLMLKKTDAMYVGELIGDWFEKNVKY
jgi:putative redox protein